MGKKNSIEKSKYINMRYKEYLSSSFKLGDGRLQKLFEAQLEKEELFKGPYVDISLPFQRGKSLNELINDGVLCESFRKLGDMNFERPLYSHQEEAIRLVGAGRSTVITTGTGSGKTECFLYPILDALLREVESGNHDPGVRAIFLYPMNALVNDQIERVRKILAACPEIRYGFFTGDTPERATENDRGKYQEKQGMCIPSNELISREEIRATPPHLLFTNYSMLEYLLIRPRDYSIISPEGLKYWKYVVLDEAHTYHGALGIEISLLLRRLTGFALKKPQFILTSATLGEKGKSENEIVEFARNLTSTAFDAGDIIFSKRIQMDSGNLEYRVVGEDYHRLKIAPDNSNENREIVSKYRAFVSEDKKECLYDLLAGDRNVYRIYQCLKDGSIQFCDLLSKMKEFVTEEQLIDLIELINKAEKDGLGLFDLKYHSFVRPLSGAFITLEKQPRLTLTKTNSIGDWKAFEIGNCRYCNSPYIIGKIQRSDTDNMEYLYQNKEVDIYENYGNNVYVNIDYFLLKDEMDEDVDIESLEPFIVCARCGAIHPAENLNARQCNCGEENEVLIYRVVQTKADKESETSNNINQCPCCGHKSSRGIVKSLDLGKDEGTALISQSLLESMEDETQQVRKTGRLSLKLGQKNITGEEKSDKIKQFLAFSDSRQQASFFKVFFDSTNTRMLRKRLIWKVIEEHQYRDISVNEMASELTKMIKEKDLFPDRMDAHKNAWAAILYDLLKVDGDYDGEGVGLYYFSLDLSEIMGQIDEEDVTAEFGQYHITKNDLEMIMQVVLDVFKIAPAINYTTAGLTPNEKKDVLEYRRFDNYIEYQSAKAKKNVHSFLPVKKGDNRVVRYVKKVCDCDSNAAKNVLDVIFNNLAVSGNLFRKHESNTTYQIDAGRYIIRNYRNTNFYRCTKCGRLTPYNVHDKCVHDKCTGTLVLVNPDEALATNYYRKQYKTKKIERLRIEEHTAQIEREQAKQYQQDFKNQKINILSCSTTFEMGIDIGNLETVFMRNIPPSPANYTQRAGRAGRRRDSAAYILTYCGTGSHDYTYFCEPEKMISGIIRPPYFNVMNQKIIVRHLMAACLGYFFRENPDYFKNIDRFVFDGGVEAFEKYVGSHPNDLNRYINERILPGEAYEEYHDFRWYDAMQGKYDKMEHFVDTVRSINDEYEKAENESSNAGKYDDARYYQQQKETLHNGKLLDALSKYCVIPKYGFPVDLVDLQVYEEGKRNNEYDLNRDLKIAISEYAPDSEVVANGKKLTSKYITLPKIGEFQRHYFYECSNCKKINLSLRGDTETKCKYCGEAASKGITQYYIEPENGFKTGITKESTRMKPKRSYSGEVSYIGGGKEDGKVLELGRLITVRTSTNDELLVVNKSKFYMCPVCGYSEIAKSKVMAPVSTEKHKNFRQFDCSNEDLREIRLGHTFQTDVARFTIPLLESGDEESFARALSFMYAFLEGISMALEIERTDIDGVLELNLDEHSYDILVYDNVPGGAGHVKRLAEREAILRALECARSKVSQKCCDEETSCYNCLRNYYNQAYHSRLKRRYAREFAETLLRELL